MTASDADASEAGDPGSFTFSRDDATGSLTVQYVVAGAATSGSDFTSLSGTLTFAAGEAEKLLVVDPLDDQVPEGTESVVVTIVDLPAYAVGSPDEATVSIADDDQVGVTESVSLAESTASGVVTGGDRTSTHATDGVEEIITEERYAGNQRTRLEHEWTFEVPGGSLVEIHIQARTTNSNGEHFVVAYSVDGSSWANPVTITDTSGAQSVTMPRGTGGTVRVRVTDVNRQRGDIDVDRVAVDQMSFVSTP